MLARRAIPQFVKRSPVKRAPITLVNVNANGVIEGQKAVPELEARTDSRTHPDSVFGRNIEKTRISKVNVAGNGVENHFVACKRTASAYEAFHIRKILTCV